MAKFEEVEATVKEIAGSVSALDEKLDEIKAYIESIPAGSVVTQEQLDSLMTSLTAAKEQAASVLAEADALDEKPTPPTEEEPA